MYFRVPRRRHSCRGHLTRTEGRDDAATTGEGRSVRGAIEKKMGTNATFKPRRRRDVSSGNAARQMSRVSWSRVSANRGTRPTLMPEEPLLKASPLSPMSPLSPVIDEEETRLTGLGGADTRYTKGELFDCLVGYAATLPPFHFSTAALDSGATEAFHSMPDGGDDAHLPRGGRHTRAAEAARVCVGASRVLRP